MNFNFKNTPSSEASTGLTTPLKANAGSASREERLAQPIAYEEQVVPSDPEDREDDFDVMLQETMDDRQGRHGVVEDAQEIKARLMRLVTKGQREAEIEEEIKKKRQNGQCENIVVKSALDKAKEDAEMLEKSFLQEAQSTINTQMERPALP